MRVGIMQPYFFPYLGHFALIAHVDHWLVFDITQYTPKTWMNRNRVLHPADGTNYVTVALANSSISIKTADAKILNRQESLQNILGKLSHYRRYAPYYQQVTNIVEEAFLQTSEDSLVSLNVAGLKAVCRYLGIQFSVDICSAMNLNIPSDLGPGDWAPSICSEIGATDYLNPNGGRHLFSKEDFAQRGIRLHFLECEPFCYPVKRYAFEPNLSVLDVLMWNNPQDVMEHLHTAVRINSA